MGYQLKHGMTSDLAKPVAKGILDNTHVFVTFWKSSRRGRWAKGLLWALSIDFALILVKHLLGNWKVFPYLKLTIFFFWKTRKEWLEKQTLSSINLLPSNISMGVMLLTTHMNSELWSLILEVHLYWVSSCINGVTESWQRN